MSLRTRLGFTEDPLYLMDASAFVYRGFYAYRNMARADGFPTNALHSVARLLFKLLREERPAYFAFILDGPGPTFRHELFSEYKAQRSATPEPLVQQLPPIRELPLLCGLPILVSSGCEADDYIATLANRFREERPVIILGADKDLKQCLHERVTLWDPSGKDEKITTLSSFQEETGMAPTSWPDYQALVGDSSDNIPGVPKIGPKTALELIRTFPTLDELFDRLVAVPPATRSKLEGQRDSALLWRKLTTLSCATCPDVTLESLAVRPITLESLVTFLRSFELHSLTREVESMIRSGVLVEKASCEIATGAFALKPLQQSTQAATKSARSAQSPKSSPLLDSTLTPAATLPTSENAAANSSSSSKSTPRTAEQGNLFTAGTPKAVTATANTPAELPDAVGPIALLAHETNIIVASTTWERLYTGTDAELAQWLLSHAASIVTVDMKNLCKEHPPLQAIPLSAWFDLAIAAYLLSPEERSYGWSALVGRWLNAAWAEAGSMSDAPEETAHITQSRPGQALLALHRFLSQQLAGAALEQIFHTLEMPLIPVLSRMEDRGIAIDLQALQDFLQEVQELLNQYTATIHTLAGRTFNIRSSQQLSDVLFTVLALPKAGKTKGGAMSTSQEALEKLEGAHPIIQSILDFRKLEKLRSTYLEPLPRLADKHGRIHTNFNQTATATGRLSSSNPNLQNIPIRGDLGGRMRTCFIAPEGATLVCADYSQIELRVLAHLSQDPTLLDAFLKNEDIHRRTASLLFDKPQAEITQDERRNAKTINFGLIYGMGAQKLAQELHISMTEAKGFIERYFSRLSVLKQFYDTIEADARNYGYVVTMTGRRRLIPEIASQNNQLRSQARRQAINTRIQGSAADIIKLAMLAVENDPELRVLEARLLLQIHDELLLEVPAHNAKAAGERLAALMSGVAPLGTPLSVPLLVDWGSGSTWGSAH